MEPWPSVGLTIGLAPLADIALHTEHNTDAMIFTAMAVQFSAIATRDNAQVAPPADYPADCEFLALALPDVAQAEFGRHAPTRLRAWNLDSDGGLLRMLNAMARCVTIKGSINAWLSDKQPGEHRSRFVQICGTQAQSKPIEKAGVPKDAG